MKKKALKYVGSILLMCCFIFLGKLSSDSIEHYMQDTLRIPIIWSLATSTLLYIGFGLLLGSDYLLKEKVKEGRWRVNLSKLIIMGIPSLILGYATYLYFLFHISLGRFSSFLVTKPSTYMSLFRILFGYIVATSFYKERSVGEIDVKE
ncbi:hypothetical protein CS063_03390 [Sporanaerobium hydrogeniformans]|uniref:Uncharacterized protein n=1 Tax=Sporanaerobium hydrogeniformans TaxID=3072179 RepID=A0AC61DFT3_9FIRM|nr:hypothetical protein [Sporanaerobium hydrogeniformans]PHV71621.1 hypothetical protein CS063_03390 [Sporanaerobium hydrogeniformans]